MFYQGSSCCFVFYFLQPHYDRTGSHRIYHLLWLLKGVCVGGRDLHMLQMQLTYSEPGLNNIWRTSLFSKQKSKHPTYCIILGEPRKIPYNLSVILPTGRSQRWFWAFSEERYVFMSHGNPSRSYSFLYAAHAAAPSAETASFYLRIVHEDFAIATDVLGPTSLNFDAQWFSVAQGGGRT